MTKRNLASFFPSTLLQRPRLSLGVGLAIAGTLLAGLPSCDSTAKFSLPDRKFNDVQVVSGFPAHIDDTGTIVRVCGAPLDDSDVQLSPNGVEFNLNFVSTELKSPLCDGDRDQSIKEGELIELTRVRASGSNSTVGPNNFQISLNCIEPRGVPGAACTTGIAGQALTPAAVNYVSLAGRCDPSREDTRLNVALVLDHSGSVSGFIDGKTNKEDNPAKRIPPETLKPSDPSNSRIPAAEFFVESLNARDRLIGYYFNEKVNVQVAGSDNITCVGGSKDGKKCVQDSDCPGGSGCFSGGASDGDSFEVLSLSDQQKKAFGSNAASRKYLLAALDDKVKYGGEGRSNVWDAIDTSYAHLKDNIPTGVRHVVVLTDGPETCSHGEDFTYVGSDGKCRSPCLNAQQSYEALRKRMYEDGYPVVVHIVQFQAQGYREPDAKLQELACRTGGTYQFINTQEMNLSDGQVISSALRRAMARVRYALSGSWRVGLRLGKKDEAMPEVKTGLMHAADGFIKVQNENFPSLEQVYATLTSWKFGPESGNEDRRVLFRKGCKTHADCGGTDECGANHCSVDGTCVAGAAPDKLPCGPAGQGQVCCSGVCSADCASACN